MDELTGFEPGPIDETHSVSDSGETDESRSDEPEGRSAEQAVNPTLSAKFACICTRNSIDHRRWSLMLTEHRTKCGRKAAPLGLILSLIT